MEVKRDEVTQAQWDERSEGIRAAQEFIDAEYQFLSMPEGEDKTGKENEKVSATAPKTPPAAEETSPDEVEGFHIDVTWLNEALKEINWSHDTAKSWLTKYQIDTRGTLEEVIRRLNQEQAQEFVKELQDRTAKKQMELFE